MDYIKARAWRLFELLEIQEFPINVLKLNLSKVIDEPFVIITYSESSDIIKRHNLEHSATIYKAFTFITLTGEIIIMYNEKLSYADRNFSLAHELGHIFLDHTSLNGILGKSDDPDLKSKQEYEADIYALAFLAPVVKLVKYDLYDSKDVARITGLPNNYSSIIWSDIEAERDRLQIIKMKNAKKHLGKQSKKSFLLLRIALCVIIGVVTIVACWQIFKHVLQSPNNNVFDISNSSTNENYITNEDNTPDIKELERIEAIKTYNLYNSDNALNLDSPFTYVFIQPDDSKYHKIDCNLIVKKSDLKPYTVNAAEINGYIPCLICYSELAEEITVPENYLDRVEAIDLYNRTNPNRQIDPSSPHTYLFAPMFEVVYHRIDCPLIKGRNDLFSYTTEEIVSTEFTPCDVCYPGILIN